MLGKNEIFIYVCEFVCYMKKRGVNRVESLGNSKFLDVFGESPINKVIDFLVVFDNFDYSMADIAENSNVGYSTLKELIPEMEKKGIIVKTRVSGKSNMYKLNKKNEAVKKFLEFYWNLASVNKKVIAE